MPNWKIKMSTVKALSYCPSHQLTAWFSRKLILTAFLFIATSLVIVPGQKASASQLPIGAVKAIIVKEAQKSKYVKPSLALAVAHVESGFRANAVSPAGAIGVMQIMPRTGRTLFGLSPGQLHEPRTNIRAGITFLDRLIEQYDGRIDLALSHYNGGSAVNKGGTKKIISYTKGYVLKVLSAARIYREAQTLTPHQNTGPSGNLSTGHNVRVSITDRSAVSTSTKLRSDLDEISFWLNASRLRDQGLAFETFTTSPSITLMAKMKENRKNFHKWLSSRRQSR